jgi:tetratricopeptide (TPR) repeat protein
MIGACRLGFVIAICLAASNAASGFAQKRDPGAGSAEIKLQGFESACTVEFDATPAGKTDPQGESTLAEIDPGDHYVHVECPGRAAELYFISPKADERVTIRPKAPGAEPTPLEAAEEHRKLAALVQKAVGERTAGQFDEAIRDLRQAVELDPENPDLHQELGITFLLLKDWARARVEYLETIKDDPTEAESHNGLGYALEKLGQIEAASTEFRIAMRLDPDDPRYREHYTEAIVAIETQKEKAKKK